jgi:hypothetical protein
MGLSLVAVAVATACGLTVVGTGPSTEDGTEAGAASGGGAPGTTASRDDASVLVRDGAVDAEVDPDDTTALTSPSAARAETARRRASSPSPAWQTATARAAAEGGSAASSLRVRAPALVDVQVVADVAAVRTDGSF